MAEHAGDSDLPTKMQPLFVIAWPENIVTRIEKIIDVDQPTILKTIAHLVVRPTRLNGSMTIQQNLSIAIIKVAILEEQADTIQTVPADKHDNERFHNSDT